MTKDKFEPVDVGNWNELPDRVKDLFEVLSNVHLIVGNELFLYINHKVIAVAEIEEISGFGHIEVYRVYDKVTNRELFNKE